MRLKVINRNGTWYASRHNLPPLDPGVIARGEAFEIEFGNTSEALSKAEAEAKEWAHKKGIKEVVNLTT